MLKIYFGSLSNEVYSAQDYFDFNYEPGWITDELSKEIIKDIDKSEVISENIILSPKMGPIPPQWISGGSKALISMWMDTDNVTYNASNCGNNCAKWIIEISKRKDLTINLHHLMDFNVDFDGYIINTNKHITTYREYLDAYVECTEGW